MFVAENIFLLGVTGVIHALLISLRKRKLNITITVKDLRLSSKDKNSMFITFIVLVRSWGREKDKTFFIFISQHFRIFLQQN